MFFKKILLNKNLKLKLYTEMLNLLTSFFDRIFGNNKDAIEFV